MSENHRAEIETAAEEYSKLTDSLIHGDEDRIKSPGDYEKTVIIQEKLVKGELLNDKDLGALGMTPEAELAYREFRNLVFSTTMGADLTRIAGVIKERNEELLQKVIETNREKIREQYEHDIQPLLLKLRSLGRKDRYIMAVIFDKDLYPLPDYLVNQGIHNNSDELKFLKTEELGSIIGKLFAKQGPQGLADFEAWAKFAKNALNEEINDNAERLVA